MEFCWALPVMTANKHNYLDLYDKYLEHAQKAEINGFSSTLIVSVPNAFDPWVLATRIGLGTKSIRLLVAQNTNHMLPTYTAKACSTLNALIGNRVDLNIITGSSRITLSRDGRADDHETRYRRTEEFVEIINKLRIGLTTYKGEFFEIEGSELYPKESSEKASRVFIAGSSEAAMSAAAKHGDYYILYASDYNTLSEQFVSAKEMARQNNRTIKCGVLVDVIARRTSLEAWEAAQGLITAASPEQKLLNKMYLNSADSVGLRRYKDCALENNPMIDEYLWAGLSKINPSNAISIVGSYQEVIVALNRFHDIGADYILLTSLLDDSEIDRLGQYVLPYVK
ncbi:LLM class flavin-dependent oxidoreductase [Bacillus pseudomycoides]|uniref:LLM class flavin-dependent oxidoreductase n=1 Tax=Bacillus pseudomycoides TaxID=64104 RepID=A0A2C3VRU0_9BACI|nr:LLM class flavin-dependent oxidoreductase [Bacillus pseudomycoides]PEA82335.1 LLM class flavin-dependent oxidoreductase [Bacillus pseudomycoides]PED73215.1 LLM class flavin-dependent oxidoreductase [Bacillus pseudomycoides]PEI43666.1 LLM class flavin-dependent oxidoreductase [Bacillus pseudomycoides]PEI86958.1 LLM class flavin-dependent oxidoreductase [Bacillus pseudomycoides]PEJ80759.1 LLM class flavin-dependent oxidoreductase [Bacillus pseudomycoides]